MFFLMFYYGIMSEKIVYAIKCGFRIACGTNIHMFISDR